MSDDRVPRKIFRASCANNGLAPPAQAPKGALTQSQCIRKDASAHRQAFTVARATTHASVRPALASYTTHAPSACGRQPLRANGHIATHRPEATSCSPKLPQRPERVTSALRASRALGDAVVTATTGPSKREAGSRRPRLRRRHAYATEGDEGSRKVERNKTRQRHKAPF